MKSIYELDGYEEFVRKATTAVAYYFNLLERKDRGHLERYVDSSDIGIIKIERNYFFDKAILRTCAADDERRYEVTQSRDDGCYSLWVYNREHFTVFRDPGDIIDQAVKTRPDMSDDIRRYIQREGAHKA